MKKSPLSDSEEHLSETVRRLERQLRLFDTTLSAITDFAYIFDRERRFIYANQALLDLLELTADEITGKNFYELPYPKDLAEKLDGQIRRVFETNEKLVDETPFTSPAGVLGYYEYIFSPVNAADGTVEVVAGSTRDTTSRRRTEEALRETELQVRLIVEAAEMGTWDWDLKSGAVRWNDQHFRLFGLEPENRTLTYKDFEQCVHPDDRQMVRERLEQAIEQSRVFQTEFRVLHPDGAIRWMSGYGRVVEQSADGEARRMTGVMFDSTERIEVESNLRLSEDRLRLLVESATDYAIFAVTQDNIIESWNAGAKKVFGFEEHEVVGKSGAILFTPEDRQLGVPEHEIETANANGRAEDERWHIRKDGSRFYASGVLMTLKDGRGFVKIARDMTDKIKIEQTLLEKEVLQKMVDAQEDERKRIARDLHDELGQQLVALRMKLEAVRKICEDKAVCDKIDEIQMIAKHLDANIDFLAWELRPASLDDLGLSLTLENYVAEWSKHSGITSEFKALRLKKDARLDSIVETNLYRITQEALNNTHKHARASKANVMLERRDRSVVLIIEDDGRGFDVEDKLNRSKGLGLVGIFERAALVGGNVEIESAAGKGTTIFVRVPVERDEKH